MISYYSPHQTKQCAKSKRTYSLKWQVTDLGEPTKVVGIEIMRWEGEIEITQQKYIQSILKREGMENAKPVTMPMDPNVKLEPNPDRNKGNMHQKQPLSWILRHNLCKCRQLQINLQILLHSSFILKSAKQDLDSFQVQA
jgi:hypothetical protein